MRQDERKKKIIISVDDLKHLLNLNMKKWKVLKWSATVRHRNGTGTEVINEVWKRGSLRKKRHMKFD